MCIVYTHYTHIVHILYTYYTHIMCIVPQTLEIAAFHILIINKYVLFRIMLNYSSMFCNITNITEIAKKPVKKA